MLSISILFSHALKGCAPPTRGQTLARFHKCLHAEITCKPRESMAFKLPSLEKSKPNPLPSVLGDNFPLFSWNELFEKEDPIGRGSFGSVFVAKRGNQRGEKVVVKKLLSSIKLQPHTHLLT